MNYKEFKTITDSKKVAKAVLLNAEPTEARLRINATIDKLKTGLENKLKK